MTLHLGQTDKFTAICGEQVMVFDVHVTVLQDKFLVIEPTRCTNFSKFYFGMKLHTFRTVLPSVIRSFPLYTQQWYMSYMFADSLWAGAFASSICSCSQAVSKPVWHISLLCVQWKTPDDGRRNCPKRVKFHSKIKFWEISASSWFYYKKGHGLFWCKVLAPACRHW